MPSYQIFFFASLFFLSGIFLKSIGLSASIAAGTILGAGFCIIFWMVRRKKIFLWLSFLLLFTLVGAVYYERDNENLYKRNIVFNEVIEFSGIVKNNPTIKNDVQEFVVELQLPFKGNVLIKTGLHPSFYYGDELNFKGIVAHPSHKGYANFLAKDGISGIVHFPRNLILVSSGNGSAVKMWLFKIRNRAQYTFESVLPPREAAFLNGITFGGYSGFTPEFKDAMSRSGTTHLVALSGYNISIVIWAAMSVLLYLFSRRLSFLLTVLLIVGFVIMTGAEASVVRAAIMGSLVMFAHGVGRIYDMRNALIFVALIMVLENPKVLVFDTGFQLSFLALLGIVYLKPALQQFFRAKKEFGFLSWRDNLFTTTSAQLAVAPLLITQFGHFSITSLLANVAILELIPVTMAIGFCAAFAALVSYYASLVLGWIAGVLLSIEVGLIHLFSIVSVPLKVNLGLGGVIVYYVSLIFFIRVLNRYVQRTF